MDKKLLIKDNNMNEVRTYSLHANNDYDEFE
jgi:hypothetical protein